MKTCREVYEEASDLLDGQLPLLSRLEMRMHLLLCVHCRRYVRHLRLLVQCLAVRGRLSTPPAGFVERVIEHLECEPQPPYGDNRSDSP
jgi:anti-sigma factor RsiW